MPLENLEEEGLPKNPDLRIAQLKFLLTMDGHRQDAKVKTELMDAIKANSELAFHFVTLHTYYLLITYIPDTYNWLHVCMLCMQSDMKTLLESVYSL